MPRIKNFFITILVYAIILFVQVDNTIEIKLVRGVYFTSMSERSKPDYLDQYRSEERWLDYRHNVLVAYTNAALQCMLQINPSEPWRIADVSANSAEQIVNLARVVDQESMMRAEFFVFDASYSGGKSPSRLYGTASRVVQRAYVSERTTIYPPQSRKAQQLELADFGGQPVYLLIDSLGALWHETYRELDYPETPGDPLTLLRRYKHLVSPNGVILLDGHEDEVGSTYCALNSYFGKETLPRILTAIGLQSHPFEHAGFNFTFLQRI